MNKHDITLLVIIIIISLISLLFMNLKNYDTLIAKVYYNNVEVLNIDLTKKEKRQYEVNGENGIVKIETLDNKIRVIEETSLYHLCSKQGYISKPYETIVCLPNKVLIKIESNDNSLDTVIK